MQPNPIKNNHPAIWDIIVNEFSQEGQPPANNLLRTLYYDLAKYVLILKGMKTGNHMQTKEDVLKILEEVKQDAIARNQFGIAKYGVALQPFNGRDVLQDAYEEVLDLAAYMRQALYEYENQP